MAAENVETLVEPKILWNFQVKRKKADGRETETDK